MLDTEVYDYTSSGSGSEGIVLGVTHHLDMPLLKNIGFSVQPGHSSFISVTTDLMNTTLGAKNRFKPEDRQCYFEEEITLNHLPHWNGFRYVLLN